MPFLLSLPLRLLLICIFQPDSLTIPLNCVFFEICREHGSKVGSGGTNSGLAAEMHRKQMLKSLAMVDVSKDPYIMKNHLGTYDCRLCMTTHPTESNYLSHRTGKRHTAGLARRAIRDAQLNQGPQPLRYAKKTIQFQLDFIS